MGQRRIWSGAGTARLWKIAGRGLYARRGNIWLLALVMICVGAKQLALAQAAASDVGTIKVTFTPDPKDTQTAVSGMLSGDTAALTRVQAVYVEVVNGTTKGSDVVQGPVDGKYSSSTYSFSVMNLKALAEGQSVQVHVCGTPVPASFTGTTTKDSAVITAVTYPAGFKFIVGGGVTGANIPVGATLVSIDSTTQITISQKATAPAAGSALQFVNGPSCSQAGPQNGAGGAGAKAALVEIVPQNAVVEVVSLYDLGRIKTYFSVGAELDGSSGSLGTTSGYVAMNVDENWLTTGNDTKPICAAKSASTEYKAMVQQHNLDRNGPGKKNKSNNSTTPNVDQKSNNNTTTANVDQKSNNNTDPEVKKLAADEEVKKLAAEEENKCRDQHENRFLVNTFLEAELTQIALSSSGSQTPAAAPVTGKATAAPAAGSSSTLDISKAKGAYVEGGVYTPFLPKATQWTFRGQDNGFFIAPIGKYIFLDPGTTPSSAVANFNVYRAYAGGVRLGHFRLPSHFNKQNPELLSYVDLTWGKWENFRETNGTRGTRFDVKSRYKIPFTILYLGFDANVGPGGSDFRVFAGTRVDISSILGKLLPSTN